ncbi:MAG: response regulator transcription factor [Eubacteriales bacterium]|nr:response regulator transcription factor [Eubacteriales bacterium]
MRLLIAEDDHDISRALSVLFQKNNYSVDCVSNGTDAYIYASDGHYDGIILDIMMPGMDGIEVLKSLRSDGVSAPVLLLTAKSDVSDRVSGLDAGADDYLPKPFAVSELLARVRAMLRRREQYQSDSMRFCGLSLDISSFELSYKSHKLHLPSREYQVMELLMQTPGMVIPTETLMERVWGWDANVEISVIWVYISNLRKKIELLNAPVNIRAVRGVGYCLESKNS